MAEVIDAVEIDPRKPPGLMMHNGKGCIAYGEGFANDFCKRLQPVILLLINPADVRNKRLDMPAVKLLRMHAQARKVIGYAHRVHSAAHHGPGLIDFARYTLVVV